MHLVNIKLKAFDRYQEDTHVWRHIPIEFQNVFRKHVPASIYKYAFHGLDTKGRPSHLKLYAKTFSVYLRTTVAPRILKNKARKEQRKAILKELQRLDKKEFNAGKMNKFLNQLSLDFDKVVI